MKNFTPIGIDHTEEVMDAFQEAGNNALLEIRNFVTSPSKTKAKRVWGINDAASLVGVSTPTLRKYEAENGEFYGLSKTDANRKQYTLEAINHYRERLGTKFHRPVDTSPMTVAIANFKGGCGKTTTAIHLAQKCAIDGIRTLIVDLDPQATTTFLCGGIIPDVELEYEDTIAETLLSNTANIRKIIRPTSLDGLDIIPGNLALQDAELTLPNHDINNHEKLGSAAFRLKNSLSPLSNDYDIIIFDCGPNLGSLTINAISASNAALIPIPPNMVDYASFVMLTRTLQRLLNATNTPFDFFRVLLTKHNGSQEALSVESMMRTIYGGYVLSQVMCETIEISKAANDVRSVYEVTKSRGSREAYRRALLHLDNVNNEIITLFKQVWTNKTERNNHE